MITARRALAVQLALLLVPVFLAALATGRVNATVLDHGYVKQQLRDLDLYQRLYAEAMPALVDDFLADQDTALPANLRGIGLPTDAASRDRIVEVVRTALPPEFLQAESEQAIDALLPWLRGSADHFTLDVSLKRNALDLFGHPAGQRSVFAQAWLDLGMSDRVLRGLSADLEAEQGPPTTGQPGTGQPGTGQPGIVKALGADYPAAVTWLDDQLFGVIDSMLPYLVGDQPGFTATVTFERYPLLAEVLARPLNRTPAVLRAEGYVLTEADLQRQLGDADSPALNNVDNSLALFRDRGYHWSDADLRERIDARQPGDTSPDPLALRRVLSPLRLLAVWGPVLVAMALIAAIALLGGRRWASRMAWGATALLVASAVALVLATAVYDATAGHALATWVADQRAAAEGALPTSLRGDLADEVQHVANEAAGHAAATARNWLIVSTLTLAGALAWPHRERLGWSRFAARGREGAPPAPPPPAPPPA